MKKIFLFTFLVATLQFIFASPSLAYSDLSKATKDGVDIWSYTSACDYTTTEKQHIYINSTATAIDTIYYFQHGDGRRGQAMAESGGVISQLSGSAKNLLFIAPSLTKMYINKATGAACIAGTGQCADGSACVTDSDGCKLNTDWSKNYPFGCLYAEALAITKNSIHAPLASAPKVILGSFSQGGIAFAAALGGGGAFPAGLSKMIFFDSCYNNRCVNFAKMPSSLRGTMIVYRSNQVGDLNTTSNKNATQNLFSGAGDNLALYEMASGMGHSTVPKECMFDFLQNFKCATVVQGTTAETIAQGGSSYEGGAEANMNVGSGGSINGLASTLASWTGTSLNRMTDEEITEKMTKPSLKIEIPGVDFSKITVGEENGLKYAYFPFLSEYIAAVYQYAVAVASVIAVCMIIFYGFSITFSAGQSEKVGRAKTRITQAIVGLVIAVSSYVILYTINPELVQLRNLKVYIIDTVTLNTWLPDSFQDGVNMSGMNLTGPGTVLGTPYQRPVISTPSCGKNLAVIARTAVDQGPICNRSCSCAWFVSTMLEISGCPTNAQVASSNGTLKPFFDSDADTLVKNLIDNYGWKDIGTSQPKAGDIVYFYRERTNITHVGIVYNANTQPLRMIDSNVNMAACWGSKAAEVYQKCSYTSSSGQIYTKDAARKQVYSDAQSLTGRTSPGVTNYNNCVASVGVCPPTLPFGGTMCNYCNKFQRRIAEEIANDSCSERQCVQISNITAGPKRHYGFLSNPNP